MYCLNHRIGILFRENPKKRSYQIRYFFLDDEANLFYIVSLAHLQKVVRTSKNFTEIKTKLVKMGERSFTIKKYEISAPRPYASDAVLPLSNRTCVEMREKDIKEDQKMYKIFGFIDEDTHLLYEEMLYLTGKKNRSVNKRKSIIEEEKEKQEKVMHTFFDAFISKQTQFKMQAEPSEDNQYEGDKSDSGQAKGNGKQILISEGITYSGRFEEGKKHGAGYLVNEHLNTLECDFIEDELAGI